MAKSAETLAKYLDDDHDKDYLQNSLLHAKAHYGCGERKDFLKSLKKGEEAYCRVLRVYGKKRYEAVRPFLPEELFVFENQPIESTIIIGAKPVTEPKNIQGFWQQMMNRFILKQHTSVTDLSVHFQH
ncbi:hypothetical protein M0G43_12785 [Subsaxibacter sp. CAU 1640]|uniref:hypothetical protein n=1 Tax=Subsaxibacter sp. CAU 1640 TaxID=2933271 RepID=UPI0020067408|nr:hypothetical protein [Subsaxibacter sp. CAU 1640]MCK7591455.1 hypothetical protein [Subsaxibacter sp. CAU 1640]